MVKSSAQGESCGPAAGKRAIRVDRYLALAACAGAGGGMVSDAAASIVYSDPLWSATLSGPGAHQVSTFGAGATAINGMEFRLNSLGGGIRAISFYGGSFGKRGWQATQFNSGSVIGPTTPPAFLNQQFFCVLSRFDGTQYRPIYGVFWAQLGGASGDSVRAFLGFQLGSGSSAYYGYFDLEVFRTSSGAGGNLGFTLHGWAYNSTAGEAITIGGVAPIPGGTGLAALAFGAAGLRGRRRSRN